MKLHRIMTDNGVEYKKRYRNRLSAWDIKQITTKPYTTKTNAKTERFIRACPKSGPMHNRTPNHKSGP